MHASGAVGPAVVGAAEGASVPAVGALVGPSVVGAPVGATVVGASVVGAPVGASVVGTVVGAFVGAAVGPQVGAFVGAVVGGTAVGAPVGPTVPAVGAALGASVVGATVVGATLGASVVGAAVVADSPQQYDVAIPAQPPTQVTPILAFGRLSGHIGGGLGVGAELTVGAFVGDGVAGTQGLAITPVGAHTKASVKVNNFVAIFNKN